MALEKLQAMIAHREALRRSRDRAWMLFAALLAAGLFLWGMAFTRMQTEPVSAAVLYAALALIASVFAVRLLSSARRHSKRLDDALRPDSAEPESSDAADV